MKTFDRKGILTILAGMLIGAIIVFIATGFEFTAVLLTLAIEVPCFVVAAILGGKWRKRWVNKGWYDENGKLAVPPDAEFTGIDKLLMPIKIAKKEK